jgi:hypothetical protein
MNAGPDRLALLRAHPVLNGIDLVVVSADQTQLDVFFVKPPSAALVASLSAAAVSLTPAPADGALAPAVTGAAMQGQAFRITFATKGPFNHQRLTLASALLDPYFATTLFNFKAGCPSPFDCRAGPDCPEPDRVRPVIDYLARDFESYRLALEDYAAVHWPQWKERHLPDVGNMMADLMAYMGAELAYYQDRVAAEATLAGATQPRSRRAHARLLDYEIAPPLAAHGLIDVQVDPAGANTDDVVEAGREVWAQTMDGQRIVFETGMGLVDLDAPATFPVNAALNAVPAYLFDEDETCLPRGSTTFELAGALQAAMPFNGALADGTPTRLMLLRTDPELAVDPVASALPERRLLVLATGIADDTDPLTGASFTRITLAHPLPMDLDLTTLTMRGNLVPVSAGATRTEFIAIGQPADVTAVLPPLEFALLKGTIERLGPGEQPTHRFFLAGSEAEPLVWLSPDGTAAAARPAVEFTNVSWLAQWTTESHWQWRRSFLGAVSSLPTSTDFTLEDGHWGVVREFRHLNQPFDAIDYAGPDGVTLRLGDGEFGLAPARGSLFRLRYKLGGGAVSNIGAETLTNIASDATPPDMALTVSNPFAFDNGADAETADKARIAAPEAWKTETYRAVRPEDYAEAAERLAWVDRASSRSLWTGSWLSVFTTPDPADRSDLPDDRRAELIAWLDRFRMTGRDARVTDPVYADLDFEITICASRDREKSDVARRVRRQLGTAPGGFFDPNDRSFGTAVERARMEAAIHSAGGVRAVEAIRFRRRGWFDWRDLGDRYRPEGAAEIIRVENDPTRPDRGTITLLMEGGA